jgi:hypothetical protein
MRKHNRSTSCSPRPSTSPILSCGAPTPSRDAPLRAGLVRVGHQPPSAVCGFNRPGPDVFLETDRPYTD